MIQFYFLSILLNGLTGYLLVFDRDEKGPDIDVEDGEKFQFSIHNGTFRLILGILTMVVGLLKLLSAVKGDVPVVGDLIPALAGLLAGFVLVFAYYRGRSTVEAEGKSARLEEIVSKNEKWVGIFAMVAAGLHFLFPSVLLL
jgi:hypothetical protein